MEKRERELLEVKTSLETVTHEKERAKIFINENKAQADESIASYEQENRYLKQTVDDLKYELEKLKQQINEHLEVIDIATKNCEDWEQKYSKLLQENQQLQTELSDLEAKNRHLFESLEKELSLRAKEYKERTLAMLNTPLRSTQASPFMTKPSFVQPSSSAYESFGMSTPINRKTALPEQQERLGNAAAKLLETLEAESPIHTRAASPLRVNIETLSPYRGTNPVSMKSLSLTPPRHDLNARVSSLMQSRARLKELENARNF